MTGISYDESIEFDVGEFVTITVDIGYFQRRLDKELSRLRKVDDHWDTDRFSLTQCAYLCKVDGPQLHYYVKAGIVKPMGKVVQGKKKFFSYSALLAFCVIVKLKTSLRINVDVIKGIQRKIAEL